MVQKGYLHPYEHCQSARHAGHYLRKLKDRAAQNIPLIPVSILFSVDLSQWCTSTHTHKTWRGFLMVWMGGSWKTRVRREPREADSAINPSNNLMKEHVVPAVVPPFPSNQTSLSSPKGLKKETAGWTTRSFKKPKDSQISGIPVRHHSNSILPRNLEVSLSLYFLTIEMEMILPFFLPDRQQVKETKNLKILYKLQLAIQAWGLIITILMDPAKHIEKVLQQYTWGQQVASRTRNKERRQHWFRHGFSKLPFTRGLGTWWDK